LKSITLCSDDFGMNTSVNEAILKLVEQGRLNAVSCMTTMDMLAPDAERLKQAVANAPHKVDIGLHLTFTEYSALTDLSSLLKDGKLPQISKLLIKTHLHQVDKLEIKSEIIAQFEQFKSIFGHKPHFVDGHQHAHILPIIRDAFLEVAPEYLETNGWIRSCHQPINLILKAHSNQMRSLLISTLSRPLKTKLKALNIKTNDLFLGINNFDPKENYRIQMQAWLNLAKNHQDETLIMCHPGLDADDSNFVDDPIKARRPDEFAYLNSDDFINDLAANNLTL